MVYCVIESYFLWYTDNPIYYLCFQSGPRHANNDAASSSSDDEEDRGAFDMKKMTSLFEQYVETSHHSSSDNLDEYAASSSEDDNSVGGDAAAAPQQPFDAATKVKKTPLKSHVEWRGFDDAPPPQKASPLIVSSVSFFTTRFLLRDS